MPANPAQTVVTKLLELPPERIREVEDFIDFLRSRAKQPARAKTKPKGFPVISVGQWPANVPTRREELYGDDGR